MPHFTKRIEVDKAYLSFYFNRIFTADGTCFHISVVDKERKTQAFNMIKKDGVWVLSNPDNCPSWIKELEKEFSRLILEHVTSTPD